MSMGVYAAIQILYHVITAYFLLILVMNLFRERSFRDQLIAAIAVIPFLLRVFGVK